MKIDVCRLETNEQNCASDCINYLYEQARYHRSTYARNVLKRCYECSWDEIKEKMDTEGSVWYVWYMDGVSRLLNKDY